MSSHKFSLESLSSKVLENMCQERRLAFAAVSPDLTILNASENFNVFIFEPNIDPVGRHVSDLIWEFVGSEDMLSAVLRGQAESFRLDRVNRELEDGTILYLSIRVLPVNENEPMKGLLLIVEDTTSNGQLEQQLVQDRNELRLTQAELSSTNEELKKLIRLKSLFLSIAAHDMRAPLTAMHGYTELARLNLPKDSPGEINDYLSVVSGQVDTLDRLITDFLDLDTIEQGNFKIRPRACDLNAIVREVAGVMRNLALRKKIDLSTLLQDELPAIHGDPERMRQVLFNLVTNAIKYSSEGNSVLIETKADTGHGLLQVTDNGPGILEEEQGSLFDLYHRTEGARKSNTKGLGLGLFIVKSIADAHGGKVSMKSEPGKSTTFIVSIPFHQPLFQEITREGNQNPGS